MTARRADGAVAVRSSARPAAAPPTPVRLTRGEAKRLGINTPTTNTRTRKVARAPYHVRCTTCRLEFTTQAGEDRHVADGHNRFELVL